MPDPAAVHGAFAARPVGGGGAADPRWDSWLLQRVDGQFTGTTDEIFQWAGCKWGLSDDLLRAVAVRESTWYQYETYPSGRPVVDWGMGDMMLPGTPGASSTATCSPSTGTTIRRTRSGIGPRTLPIAGVCHGGTSWGQMPTIQNGMLCSTDSPPHRRRLSASAARVNGWEYGSRLGAYVADDVWGGRLVRRRLAQCMQRLHFLSQERDGKLYLAGADWRVSGRRGAYGCPVAGRLSSSPEDQLRSHTRRLGHT
jgi:hypothetical protein